MTITKDDLADTEKRIVAGLKTVLELTVKPIIDDIGDHKKTLYGKEGNGGLVGRENTLKGSIRTLRWVSSTAIGAVVLKIAADIFNKKIWNMF